MYQCLLLLTEQFFKENVPLSRHQCQMRAKLVKTIHCAFVVKYSSYKWMSKLKMCHVQKKSIHTYYVLIVRLPLRWRKSAMRQLLYYMTQKIVLLFVADFFFVKRIGGENDKMTNKEWSMKKKYNMILSSALLFILLLNTESKRLERGNVL